MEKCYVVDDRANKRVGESKAGIECLMIEKWCDRAMDEIVIWMEQEKSTALRFDFIIWVHLPEIHRKEKYFTRRGVFIRFQRGSWTTNRCESISKTAADNDPLLQFT